MQHKRIKLALAALTVSVILAFSIGLTGTGQDAGLALVEQLEALLLQHYWTGLLLYILGFALLISLTLPMATLFTVTGGYLFGIWPGAAAALAALTLGAMLTFASMRAFGVREDSSSLRSGRGRALFDLLDRNAVLYVALLRVVPVAPCFAVNAGAAITRIDFVRFSIASLIGLTPSAIVYASVGTGLNTLVEARQVLGPRLLLEPQIGLPLLGVVALICVSWMLRRHLPGLAPEA